MRVLKAAVRVLKNYAKLIDRHGPVINTLATAAIAVLTAFYVYYSHAQWKEMRKATDAATKSANIAEAASISASRAWIAPQNAGLMAELERGKPTMIEIQYNNPGKEPALDVRAIYRFKKVEAEALRWASPKLEAKLPFMVSLSQMRSACIVELSRFSPRSLKCNTTSDFVKYRLVTYPRISILLRSFPEYVRIDPFTSS